MQIYFNIFAIISVVGLWLDRAELYLYPCLGLCLLAVLCDIIQDVWDDDFPTPPAKETITRFLKPGWMAYTPIVGLLYILIVVNKTPRKW